MNSHIIYCDTCYTSSLLTTNTVQYYISNCGKVSCQNCLQLEQQHCGKCGTNCSRKLISTEMSFDTLIFFQETLDLMQKVQIADSFQMRRLQQLAKYLFQKLAKLNQSVSEKSDRVQQLEERKCSIEFSLDQLKQSARFHQQPPLPPLPPPQQHQQPNFGSKRPFLSSVINQIETDVSFASNNTSGQLYMPSVSNVNHNRTPSQTGSRISGKGSLIGRAAPFMRTKKIEQIETNFIPCVYNSTPLIGHEPEVNNFGFREPPPSSIISASTLRYFKQKRERASSRFFK